MKLPIKPVLSGAKIAATFIFRNWRIITPIVGLVSASTAAYMGQLAPLADAVSQVVQ